MYTFSELYPMTRVLVPKDLSDLMMDLAINFGRFGKIYVFLVGSTVHDLLDTSRMRRASDVDLVLFIGEELSVFHPILRTLFACPHVPGLYQITWMGHYKVDLMVVEQDFSNPNFLIHYASLKHDFTISSLFCDLHGQIYDPSGRGLRDYQLKTLNLVSSLEISQVINHLTILRVLKYAYRGFRASPDLIASLHEIAYTEAFSDPHFCHLLGRSILPKIEMIHYLKEWGLMTKLLMTEDWVTLSDADIHHLLLMKSLRLKTALELNQDKSSLDEENHNLALQIEEEEQKIARLTLEHDHGTAELEHARVQQTDLLKTIEALQAKIEDVELKIHQARLETLKNEALIDDLKHRQRSLMAEHSRLTSAASTKQVKMKMNKEKSDKKDQSKIELLQKNIKELKKKIVTLKINIQQAHEQKTIFAAESQTLSQEEVKAKFHKGTISQLCKEGETACATKIAMHPLVDVPMRSNFFYRGMEGHPWEGLDEKKLEFIVEHWAEPVLKIPLGMVLAIVLTHAKKDVKALLLLMTCKSLALQYDTRFLKKIDFITNKIKLKYPQIYWQNRSAKEWYEFGQHCYHNHQYLDAMPFYLLASQVDKSYLHPLVQMINVAIQLNRPDLIMFGLQELIRFGQSDENLTSTKLKAHATKTIEGVFQNLNKESMRLHRLVHESTPNPKTLTLAWRLFSLQQILHSDIFRDYPRPCFDLVETTLRILSLSDADDLSKVMAHLNLFHLLSDSPLAEQHFKQALTLGILPELEAVYAMKPCAAK